MPPKRPLFRREVTPAEVDAVCSLLLGDANERHRKQVKYTTDDVRQLIRVWLTSNSLADLAEVFSRAVAACDSDWLSILYFPPDFVSRVGAMPHGKQLPVFPPGMSWREAKEELVRQSLIRNSYNRSAAGRELGFTSKAVYNIIEHSEGRIPLRASRESLFVQAAVEILSQHPDGLPIELLMQALPAKQCYVTPLYAQRIMKKNSRTFSRKDKRWLLLDNAQPSA